MPFIGKVEVIMLVRWPPDSSGEATLIELPDARDENAVRLPVVHNGWHG